MASRHVTSGIESEILSISGPDASNGSHMRVMFNPDPLYPGGGGQPCDKGYVTWNANGKEMKAEIFECIKTPAGNESILDEMSDKVPNQGNLSSLEKGMRVLIYVDVQRRTSLTRAHSGEHVLFQSIQRALEKDTSSKRSVEVKKVDLDVLESSLFVLTNSLSWDDLLNAERLANSIIKEDRQVMEHNVTKNEFIAEQQKGQHSKYKDIRIKLDRIKDNVIRIIEVQDFDYSACAGTHVKSTREIGNLLITKFANSGPGEFEIRFKVDTQDVFSFAGYARMAATAAHTNIENLVPFIQRLIEEQDALKESARAMQRQQSLELSSMKIEDVDVRTGMFSFDDKKILIEKISSLLHAGEVAVIGNKPQSQDSSQELKGSKGSNGSIQAIQIFFFSKNQSVDAGALLRKLAQHLPLKGGGSKTFAAGGTTASFEEVMAHLQKLLKTP